jgi:CheY-like chemotaxis protein
MDLRMDGMDGISATQAIRAREASEGWTRSAILALSASAFDRDREWLLESGCDDFIAKPYREAAIFEALARHLGIRFVHEGDGRPAAAAATAVVATSRLSSLSTALRSSLKSAVQAGDLRAARQAVSEIAHTDESLAAALREMVEGFRLEEIEAMLEGHG